MQLNQVDFWWLASKGAQGKNWDQRDCGQELILGKDSQQILIVNISYYYAEIAVKNPDRLF